MKEAPGPLKQQGLARSYKKLNDVIKMKFKIGKPAGQLSSQEVGRERL